MNNIYMLVSLVILNLICYGQDEKYITINKICEVVNIKDIDNPNSESLIKIYPKEIYNGFSPSIFTETKEKRGGRVIQLNEEKYYLAREKNPANYDTLQNSESLLDLSNFEKINLKYISKIKEDNETYIVFDFNELSEFNDDTVYIRKINGDLLTIIPSENKKSKVKEFPQQVLRIHIPNTPTIVYLPKWDNVKFDLNIYDKFTINGGSTYYFEKESKNLYKINSNNEPELFEKLNDSQEYTSLIEDCTIKFENGEIVWINKDNLHLPNKLLYIFLALIILFSIGFGILFYFSGKYKIKKGDTLNTIAENANLSIPVLTYLNRDILKDKTPDEDLFNSETVIKINKPRWFQKTIKYVITENDTLKSIAEDFDIETDVLKANNSKYKNFEVDGIVKNKEKVKLLRIPLIVLKEPKDAETKEIPLKTEDFKYLVSNIESINIKLESFIGTGKENEELEKLKKTNQVLNDLLDKQKTKLTEIQNDFNDQKSELIKCQNELKVTNTFFYKFPENDKLSSFLNTNNEIFDSIISIEDELYKKLNYLGEKAQREEQIILTLILGKYLKQKPVDKFESWKNILQQKIIVDRDLINRLNGHEENEQIRVLKTGVYNDVYQKTLSGLFILLSELSFFSTIAKAESNFGSEIQSWASQKIVTVDKQVRKNLQCHTTLITLFTNRKDYGNKIEMDIVHNCSPYLKDLELPPDTIREIISIGLKIDDKDIGYTSDKNITTFKNA